MHPFPVLQAAVVRYLIQGIGYGLTAAAQPGPFQTYVLSQTLSRGWRRALPAALAPLISDGPIIAVALVVLSQVPDSMQRLLYIASGLFILYLAWGAFRAWREFDSQTSPTTTSEQRSVLRAALMNALSPAPYIYWSLVTGPILLSGWRESPTNGIGFLIGFYTAMVATMGGLIVLFGTARRLGPRVNRALLGVSVVALVCFGLIQLHRGIFGL